MLTAALIIALVIALAALGVSLAYALGTAAVVAFVVTDSLPFLAAAPQRIFSQLDVFAIMAMPLFILAGELMNRAGITRALIDVAMLMLARLPGGLGHVNIMTSVFFAGISGSATADIAAMSNTFVPQMEKRGYDRQYAGAVTAASSVIGPIIPPSIVLILYGAIMSTDVAALFAAGVVPGLLLAAALFATNAWYARREGHPGGAGEERPPLGPTLKKGAPALLLPVIILGGIVFGIVTPIEAGALACLAAVVIGFAGNGLTWASITQALRRTATLTGSIFMIIAAASLLSYLIVLHQVPDDLATLVANIHVDGIWFVLVIMLTFLLLGMGFDFMLGLTVVAPLLVPIAVMQGADPVAMGLLICLNLSIGLITPPLGGAIMMVATITGDGYWGLCRRVLPFVLAELAVLLLIAVFPEIALALPRALGLL
ncbi:TRAP transporter large permease [Marinihelvus fidelis]|uniref:TRAP transporter large permease protein n=1 Tax=Marinihelvus fidelis TaxID=2613842 RepID=A0A5N0T4B9_9GAMM|nr:TRAP transporter large permease [Marinihelvus fidelis]KAA9129701.1 TRAP transporter large permease [Marinihelvus fidelis]